MKVLITIIWLSCFYFSGQASEVKKIEELLMENTKELSDTKLILQHIGVKNDQIKANIEQQQVWLLAIQNVEGQFIKLRQFLDAQSVVVLQALNNITLKSGLFAEDLNSLARLQISTKQQISSLEQKLEAYQKQLLANARGVDTNILDLTKLITRAVLPQLNGLQCSFDSLETSQINIEVELKSLARIKDISENSNSKLNIIGEQLVNLNRTQTPRLSALTSAVKQLKPLNTWQIEAALRELIISQKRIELDLEACQKHSSPHYHASNRPDSYKQSYDMEPIHTQSQAGKQVDQVQTWSIEKQTQQNPHYDGKQSNIHYSQSAGYDHNTNNAHSVSLQMPLPWETVTYYQSVPTPSPKPQSSQHGSAPQQQYSHNPASQSASSVYGPSSSSYSHEYQNSYNNY